MINYFGKEFELFPENKYARLVNGLYWFMRSSEWSGEPPAKQAIRITDILVSRASALLTHISIMLAVAVMLLQYYYPEKNADFLAYILAGEIIVYLILALLFLRSFLISGPIVCRGAEEEGEELKEFRRCVNSNNTSWEAEIDKYYKEKKFIINEEFVKYIFEVLKRRRAFRRTLFCTYAITFIFLATTATKFFFFPTRPVCATTAQHSSIMFRTYGSPRTESTHCRAPYNCK